ncbi:MAG: hypothetical protein ACI9XO_004442, partial [Paraglaciecola sp.]
MRDKTVLSLKRPSLKHHYNRQLFMKRSSSLFISYFLNGFVVNGVRFA